MKRILIFFAILLPIVGFSQNKSYFYSADSLYFGVITPYNHYEGYIQTPIYDSLGIPYDSLAITTMYAWLPSQYGYVSTVGNNFVQYPSSLTDYTVIAPRGFAQPMHTDTMLSIGGVASFLFTPGQRFHYNDVFDFTTNSMDTICILDGLTLEPIYEKVLNDTLNYNGDFWGFCEIIFDSAVCVQGDYYIAYKYCDKNMEEYDDSFYSPDGAYYMYVKLFLYSMPLVPYWDIVKISDLSVLLPYTNYNKQIRVLSDDYEWMNLSEFYIQFYGGITKNYYIHFITASSNTDLSPTDRGAQAHTTDLIVFGIKESAIIDSIDRPWLFTQDTTITDSTDTNSYISQIDLERMIAVQPNPSKGEVVISCPEPLREVALLNPMGQVLYRENYNQKRITLDLSSYPQGVYILHLQTPNGEVRKKVIRQ